MFAQVWLLFSEVERGFGLAAENAHQGSRAQHGDLQFCALPCGDMINAAICTQFLPHSNFMISSIYFFELSACFFSHFFHFLENASFETSLRR